jgi:hypothetical protein
VALGRAWEYPACVVRLDDETVAVAAGYPTDDGEALADWAARVASKLSRERARAAVVSGTDAARRELAEALSLVGIEVRDSLRRSGWLRLPWRPRTRE